METQKAAFDRNRRITIALQAGGEAKSVVVRFPTDQEWTERQRRRKVIIKQLGRGKTETIVPDSTDLDLALLSKIREDGAEVDAYEAQRIVEQLGQAEVDDVAAEAGQFRIRLRVVGDAITEHVVRMPTAKQMIQYRRGFARVIDLPFNRQEVTINLETAGELYREIGLGTGGYDSDVPVIHQAVVVKAAVDAVDLCVQEDKDGNF